MRNTIMHFYTSLSSPEQKTLLARYIYGAANEVIRSDFFGTLPQNHRDALTGADEQARIETAIRYARKAGRKLCVPDEATGSIRVNNRDSFKNCFAVFILDGILRSDDLPERVNLVFQRGGAAAQTYGTIVSEMNGLLGREVLAAPAPRQPQSVPGAYMPQNESGDAYLPQQTAGNAPVPPAINPQPAVQKKKTNILIPILAVVLVLLLVVGGGVALMVHLAHRQDTDTPAGEIVAAENSADVYDAASDSSVAEMQPPAVQILQEYEFDGTHDFVAGKAWVSYKSRDNNNYERTYRAVINTSGEILYAFPEYGQESDFSGEVLHTEVFDNGTAAYYMTETAGAFGTVVPGIGFVLLDQTGQVSFRSDDHDETTDYYFLAYDEGKYLLRLHKADFSSSSDSVVFLDSTGRIIDTVAGGYGDGKYVGNGLFELIGSGSADIYDCKSKSIINSIPEENYLMLPYYASFGDYVVLQYYGDYTCAPAAVFRSAEAFDRCVQNDEIKTIDGDDFGKDGIVTHKLAENQYEFRTLSGQLVCETPDFPENTYIGDMGAFNGGYCAATVEGNDRKNYVAVFDTSGKLKYDPVKLECDNKDHEKINNSVYTFKAQTNGYVLICDHKAVTPEGKVVDANSLPDDVLAELKGANDGLIEKHDSDTEKAWYEDIRGTVVLDKAKLTDKSVVED